MVLESCSINPDPLNNGRGFNETDKDESTGTVVVINTARKYKDRNYEELQRHVFWLGFRAAARVRFAFSSSMSFLAVYTRTPINLPVDWWNPPSKTGGISIVKRLIQERNNAIKVRIEPKTL